MKRIILSIAAIILIASTVVYASVSKSNDCCIKKSACCYQGSACCSK